jgi:hypothetical protein
VAAVGACREVAAKEAFLQQQLLLPLVGLVGLTGTLRMMMAMQSLSQGCAQLPMHQQQHAAVDVLLEEAEGAVKG